MGGTRVLRSLMIAVVLAAAGFAGMVVAKTVQLPPGRVVDAVADTNALAIGSAGLLEDGRNERDRGEAAIETFSYDWQTGLPGWEISFHPGRRGVLGYTFVQEKKIEIYVRAEMSDPLLAHVIAHEIGHAIDVSKNSGDDRRRWQAARDIEEEPWWPGNGATDFSTGAGDFAESFAAWQVGDASFRSSLGPAPNAEQNALMAELVLQP